MASVLKKLQKATFTFTFYSRRNPWYSFLDADSTPGHMVLSVATEKIPSDTTGNRSRDRPTISAVPQPLRYPTPPSYVLHMEFH